MALDLGMQAGEPPRRVSADVAGQAARWMARLWSDNVTEADRQACAQWRALSAEHEQAWQRLQSLEESFRGVSDQAARRALKRGPVSQGRRAAMRTLGFAISAAGAYHLLRESPVWQSVSADYATGVGEIRDIILPDQTRLVLNTDTAVDIVFTEHTRRILLRRGEIIVTSGHEADVPYRPLSVEVREGEVSAIGTVFSVRQHARDAEVAVQEGAVDVAPRFASDTPLRLTAGQGTRFDNGRAGDVISVSPDSASWARGVVVAHQMRVGDLVAELARYRRGVLRCDPAVADWRVTGVYPLRDTDRALQNLTLALPLQVGYRTRYWVSVMPR